jgi:membrane complex biogenesis BtpA family protein
VTFGPPGGGLFAVPLVLAREAKFRPHVEDRSPRPTAFTVKVRLVSKAKLREMFGVDKPLIAMCHLPGLPGRPRHDVAGGIEVIAEWVAHDLAVLQEAGVDGLLFCNENDIPYQVKVGPEVGAAMAAAITRVLPQVHLPFGVNLLWDPAASLAVARATGAAFVREVFTGAFEGDTGLIKPAFGDLAAYRHNIGADGVAIFTNITPEFSRSLANRTVAERARGAVFLGVDAILVSGPMAGTSAAIEDLREAYDAVPDAPVLANTGVNHENVAQILTVSDGAIVGTSLKVDGITWNRVDLERAKRMVELFAHARES